MTATETVDSVSISDLVKPNTRNLVFTLQLTRLTFSNLKGQCEAFFVCSRKTGTGQMTRLAHCLQTKAFW